VTPPRPEAPPDSSPLLESYEPRALTNRQAALFAAVANGTPKGIGSAYILDIARIFLRFLEDSEGDL
jgi:hypothetical protein